MALSRRSLLITGTVTGVVTSLGALPVVAAEPQLPLWHDDTPAVNVWFGEFRERAYEELCRIPISELETSWTSSAAIMARRAVTLGRRVRADGKILRLLTKTGDETSSPYDEHRKVRLPRALAFAADQRLHVDTNNNTVRVEKDTTGKHAFGSVYRL